MHTRRLVAFLLGLWLGGIFLVAYVTNANVAKTRAINDNPVDPARRLYEQSGPERIPPLLNYNTSEINRGITLSWEWVQLGAGFLIVCALPFAMRFKWLYLIGAAVMFVIAVAQRGLLTPEMIGLGRMLDFAGGDLWTQDALWKERRTLRYLQDLYLALDLVKAAIGIAITFGLLIFRRKAAYKKLEKVDAVDNPNYSHVNR